jgi:hypothetical protein
MRLVTIAVFASAFIAHLVEGRLQADGIECYVQDEHTLQVNPLYNNALGGIKLQVKEEDVQTAVTVLRMHGYRTVFDNLPTVEKQQHVVVRFLKFLAAALLVLGWLYLVDFKG